MSIESNKELERDMMIKKLKQEAFHKIKKIEHNLKRSVPFSNDMDTLEGLIFVNDDLDEVLLNWIDTNWI